jgi:MoaA/NifB/PqqE/SkfB family radical SAM enzyme
LSVKIVYGFRVHWFFFLLNLKLIIFLIRKFGLSFNAFTKWKAIQKFKSQFTIEKQFFRFVKHEKRIYLNCNIPGLPFPNYYESLLRFSENSTDSNLSQMGIVQIGFTKKCPLNCEHCYEGKVLNSPESVTLEEHKTIVAKLQKCGVPMFHFGGGEPFNRFEDLIVVLKSAKQTSDFWIYSSGYGLSYEKAKQLKEAGLTGVSISLDHFQADQHNAFRRNNKSFEKAVEAIQNVQSAGMLTAITICVTRSFCTKENLNLFHQFTHELNVPFVQLMEPRSTGNYEGKDVLLQKEHFEILEAFYISRNTEKKYKQLPIIQYTGYQQRKKGCGGAGNRYIYIDTDGFVLACPFCSNRKSHFLYGDISEDLKKLKVEGCALINTNEN